MAIAKKTAVKSIKAKKKTVAKKATLAKKKFVGKAGVAKKMKKLTGKVTRTYARASAK